MPSQPVALQTAAKVARCQPPPLQPSTPASQVRAYFAPLIRIRRPAVHGSGSPQTPHGGHGWLVWPSNALMLLRGSFLVSGGGRFELKNVAVYWAAYHYFPAFVAVVATTVNCVLHIAFTLVFPDLNAQSFDRFLVSRALLPRLLLLLGVTSIGYKAGVHILDCVIDSCRLVVHSRSPRSEMPFFDLYSQLSWHRATTGRLVTLVIVFAIIASAAAIVVDPPAAMGFTWGPRRDSNVVVVLALVVVVEIIYFCVSFGRALYVAQDLRRSVDDGMARDDPIYAKTWAATVLGMRRMTVGLLFCLCMVLALEQGPSYGWTCFAEATIYLAIIHIGISLAVKLSMWLHRFVSVLQVMSTSLTAVAVVATSVLPLTALGIASATNMPNSVAVVIQFLPIGLLLVNVVELSTPPPPQSPPPQPSISWVRKVVRVWSRALLLHHAERRHRACGVAEDSPHERILHLCRVAVRMTFFIMFATVAVLCWWFTSQLISGVASTSAGATSCEWTSPTSIHISTGPLNVTLFGVDAPSKNDAGDPLRYAGLCQRTWAHHLQAGDLAYFSTLSYMRHGSTSFSSMFAFYKQYHVDAGTDWEVVFSSYTTDATAASTSQPAFHHIRSRTRNTSVISIRGTDQSSASDFLQNALIFSETFIFSAITTFVPGSSLLSDSVVKDLIRAASSFHSWLLSAHAADGGHPDPTHRYDAAIANYVLAFLGSTCADPSNAACRESFVLTGHSLGGTLAQIVGAKHRLAAVAFSSPGIVLLERKYGIGREDLDAYVTNIVVSNDFFPNIGKLGGTVHHVACEETRADVCHAIELQTIRQFTNCLRFRQSLRVVGNYSINPFAHRRPLERLVSAVGNVARLW